MTAALTSVAPLTGDLQPAPQSATIDRAAALPFAPMWMCAAVAAPAQVVEGQRPLQRLAVERRRERPAGARRRALRLRHLLRGVQGRRPSKLIDGRRRPSPAASAPTASTAATARNAEHDICRIRLTSLLGAVVPPFSRSQLDASRAAWSLGWCRQPARSRAARRPRPASATPARISARPPSETARSGSPSSSDAVEERDAGDQVGDEDRPRRAGAAEQREQEDVGEPGADEAEHDDRARTPSSRAPRPAAARRRTASTSDRRDDASSRRRSRAARCRESTQRA